MRDPGWYWVKYGDQWEIGRWYGMYWVLSVGAENYYIESKVFYDSELSEIDERRITREPRIVYSPHKFTEEEKKENEEWLKLITWPKDSELPEKSSLGDKLFGLI